ncbi:substrate-binding domain-containing protein [Leptolyngbya sp. PCC 6406]|uniref:substrate-binding domain-containing protein n=1 Tax=Leptolyngbya sp. PCC 6406 TaxID=1173264 RepID=UPI0002ABA004|nr:substrate-binding domain-containing protein [Leptolyngbya sp. PCC 6406]
MMMVLRNRSLLVMMVLAAMALPLGLVPAEAQDPEAVPPEAVPAESAPAENTLAPLTPTFLLPESLPADTRLRLDGSVAMATINRTLIRGFEAAFPNVTVVAAEQGGDGALAALLTETVDLVALGRPLSDEELAQGLIEVPISREKIAIIVSSDNPFQGDLTFQQFAQMLRGEITNWSQVGGPDLPLQFIDRPDTSDTRRALGDYDVFKAAGFTTGATAITLEEDSTAAVVNALGNSGVSYGIASQVLDQANVRVLTMHGTLPDDPRYPYSQPRGYVYRGSPTPAVEAFLAFATTPTGQAAVQTAKAAEAAEVATAELPDSALAMRPNGEGFVTGDRDGTIEFWQADSTAAGEPLEAHIGPVTALKFTADGNRLISGGADGEVRFWDAIGTPVGDPIAAHDSPVTRLSILPDGSFFSASIDGSVRRWDDQGTPLAPAFAAHEGTVRDLATSADGQLLVTAGKDGTIKLWNADGTPRTALAGHSGPVNAVAVKPDNTLVSGGEDGTVRQWDGTGNPLGEPRTLENPVKAIALSPDGQQLAAGDAAGIVQVWGADGNPAGDPIVSGEVPVGALSFSPDGSQLVVATGSTPPQLRDPISGDLVATASEAETGTNPLDLSALWGQLQQLPPRIWILIPVALLGLLLFFLLRGWQAEATDGTADGATEGDEEEAGLGLASDAEGGMPKADETQGGGTVPAAVAAISPYEAANSLDKDLVRAKAALSEGDGLARSGQLQMALGRVNQAIEAADLERLKALAAGVSLVGVGAVVAQAMARRGGILAALGRGEDALKSYDRALEMDPNTPDTWVGKGNLLLSLNRPDEALFSFDKALELNPQAGSAWQGRATALQRLQREGEARTALAKAQEFGPSTSAPYRPLTAAAGGAAASGAAAGGAALERMAQRLRPDPVPGDDPDAVPLSPAPEVDAPDRADPVLAVPPGLSADIPSDLQDAIADLPSEADSPNGNPETPPMAIPPEVQTLLEAGNLASAPPSPEIAAPPALPDLSPPDIGVPDLNSPDPRSPDLLSPNLGSPDLSSQNIQAILDMDREMGTELDGEPIDDLTLFSTIVPSPASTPGADLGRAVTPEVAGSPDVAAVPDVPDPVGGGEFNLWGDLPPEVLAALEGIPEDSPDRFIRPRATPPPPPPRRPLPPPPPSNPRLQSPPPGTE